jgi:branched-chain amino acid transport system substrate-binding protein
MRLVTAIRFPAVVLTAVVLAGACSGAPASSPGSTDQPATPSAGGPAEVVFGAALPLTGASSQLGQNSLNGIELEATALNAAGGIKSMGGAKIRIVSRDVTSDPGTAAAAVQQMLDSDKPLGIIGAYASTLTLAIAPVTERAHVPVISSSLADSLTTSGYTNMFLVGPLGSELGVAQLTFAKDVAAKDGKAMQNIAIVHESGAFGTTAAEGLAKTAQALGINVVLNESYDAKFTDATPLAAKITASHPDALFPISYLNDGVLLMRALKASGAGVPVFGGIGAFSQPDFGKNLGGDADQVFTVNIQPPATSALWAAFNAEYVAKYQIGFTPVESQFNAAALAIYAEALETNPTTDPKVLSQTLHTGRFSAGITGQLPGGAVEFGASGRNTLATPVLDQWQGGKLLIVWPEDSKESPYQWPNATATP